MLKTRNTQIIMVSIVVVIAGISLFFLVNTPKPEGKTAENPSGERVFYLRAAVGGFNGSNPTMTVKVGEKFKVNVTNRDSQPHTFRGERGEFDSGVILQGTSQEISLSFDKPGTHTYKCDVHPTTMIGKIVVQSTENLTGERTLDMTVTARGFNGTNPTIKAKVGEKFNIRIVNKDTITHSFTVGPGKIKSAIMLQGTSQEISLSFDKPGTYTYKCDYHPSMNGQIIVE